MKNSRDRSYIQFKMKYHAGEYLNDKIPVLLSQFRAGILPLRIETDRFYVKSGIENGKNLAQSS